MNSRRRRMLWVKSAELHPLDSGGKIRTFRMLEKLKESFEIHYLAFQDPRHEPDPACVEYSDRQTWIPLHYFPRGSPQFALAALKNVVTSRLPLVLERFRAGAMRAAIEEAAKDADLVISDFLTASINFPRDVASRSVLFQHNVEAEIWRRMTEAESRPLMKTYLRDQHRRMERAEQMLSADFRKVIAVSEPDATYFRERYGLTNVSGAVPTGVDSEYFGAVQRAPAPGQLVFLGSMDWAPNIDAVEWLLEEIFPLILVAFPAAKLRVIGRNPPRRLIEKAAAHPGVHFTGTVDDVRPHLEDAAVAIVPLRAGSGTRIKIFELMAAGVPVVSTTVGAEGLPAMDGEHILLADSPEALARATTSILSDASRAQSLSEAARSLVEEGYGWGEIADQFVRLVN